MGMCNLILLHRHALGLFRAQAVKYGACSKISSLYSGIVLESEKTRISLQGLSVLLYLQLCLLGRLLFCSFLPISPGNLGGYMAVGSHFLVASHTCSLKSGHIVKWIKISLGLIRCETGLVMPRWWCLLDANRKTPAGDTEDVVKMLGGLMQQNLFPRVCFPRF